MKKNLAPGVGLVTIGLSVALALAGCTSPASTDATTTDTATATTAPVGLDEVFASLRTSVGVGALAGHPHEGDWGDGPLTDDLFDEIADAGFTAVRLPVRFSGYQDATAPYTIDPEFLDRVEWAVDGLTERGLTVIVTNFFSVGAGGTPDAELLFTDPASRHDRFLAVWEQVAPLLADRDGRVVFEILNEPHDALSDVWNEYQLEALAVIRETNPTRPVILTSTQWSNASSLDDLILPDDPNIIVTIHHYGPMEFTHQGVTFIDPPYPTGVEWPGENLTLASPWWDWSWDTDRTWTPEGLTVTYTSPWASLRFIHPDGVADPASVSFTIDADVEVAVSCLRDGLASDRAEHVMARAGERMTVAVSACSGRTVDPGASLTAVLIQNTGGSPAPFTITDARVTTEAGDIEFFVDPLTQVQEPILAAAEYGREHGVPVFLGEFGANASASMDSRLRWTEAVRTCAVENGLATSYWGFAGDFDIPDTFAIFDPSTGTYHEELLDAATAEP
jgi:aryl-phospho-beta-D-glucosidase BglC (GH1 family)